MMILDGWAIALVATKFALYAGTALAAGGTLFRVAFADDAPGIGSGVLPGAAVAALASVASIAVKAGLLAGAGVAGAFDPMIVGIVVDSPSGWSVGVRVVALSVLVAALRLDGAAGRGAGAVGAVLAAASFAMVGHAQGGPLLPALLTAHLLAVFFWIGSLPPLSRSARGADLESATRLSERFGAVAVWIVGLLVAAGAGLAALLLDSPAALVTSAYGRVLSLKVLAVVVVMAFAALNKLCIVPLMRSGDATAALRLRRSIALEAGAMGVVLLATAVLTTVLELP